MDFNRGLDELYGSGRHEANVKEMVDSPLPQINSSSDKMMTYALSSSTKKDNKNKQQGDDDEDVVLGLPTGEVGGASVTVRDDTIPGFVDASQSGNIITTENIIFNRQPVQDFAGLPQEDKLLDENIHCNEKVQKQIEELLNQRGRTKNNNATGKEFGFRVDRNDNGTYSVGDVIEGGATEVSIPKTAKTVATFHSHPSVASPSSKDMEIADDFYEKYENGYVTYVVTTGRLTLYNPNNPRKGNSKNKRIVDASDCPKKNKSK